MNLRHLALATACLGAAGIAACGGGPTLNVVPAAATGSAPAAQSPAPSSASGSAGAQAACDAGRWMGAISPEGRPDGFDAGDAGAVYVWHEADGWHLRATDLRATDHHYTGTIRLTPNGAFAGVRPVRDERDDRVSVDGDGVLHYDFHTYASIDGVDFRVTCGTGGRDAERQRLAFRTLYDGQPVAARVRIGDTKQIPRSADFGFVRSA